MVLKPNLSVSFLPGVGEKVEIKLNRLGIFTIKDLLEHYPFRYEDTTNVVEIADLEPSSNPQTIAIELVSIKNFYSRNGKQLTEAVVADQTASMKVLWFNQHFLTRILKPGKNYLLSGKLNDQKTPTLLSPKYEFLKDDFESDSAGSITPIYPETEGISSKFIHKLIKTVLKYTSISELLKEDIPKTKIAKAVIMQRGEAVKGLHFPTDLEGVEEAKNSIAFREIYAILKDVQKLKKERERFKAQVVPTNTELVDKFLDELPFKPTKDQLTTIKEINEDLGTESPMNRLLEGDVGSGKTLVAMAAILNIVSNDMQAAIIAPTQVLAEQHYKTFAEMLPWLLEEIELVTGNSKPSVFQKKIIIGTHAVLHQAQKLFNNLALVIIDEQHRFGVKQREFLTEYMKTTQQNEKVPHILSMTATPIPRTMVLTLYGDTDLSVIKTKPKGRIPVDTFMVSENKRNDSYNWISEQVQNGGQVFVICPLVEESDKIQVKSAKAEFERLKDVFPDLKIELVHGKVKPVEKEKILQDFKDQKFDILVSTAVVEVGIDIPNATVILIESAERFGLAQLHQFRGRVGRSDKKSYCLLFTESDTAQQRLEYFSNHNDGLKIAEFDLQNRGPGEVYGTKQAGIPNLKFANLLDLEFIKWVKEFV